MIEIPNFKNIDIKNIVFDYNGTLAKDGYLSNETKELLHTICGKYSVYVVTADTFGTVKEQLKEFDLKIKVLTSKDHTKEKGDFIKSLDKNVTASVGNGNNDKTMLEFSVLSIAIAGNEGCSKDTLLASDIVCNNINDAIELFLYPKRIIATLRK